ncbi:uncharacterized protein LOC110669905 isoform X2 [Hevea brasiliensis]|uniref:uncharacterized protein LOC110669905 isoform X2 n=1 Tax=Hevea brasiliensis TaxID=3981 RepID=UPI0025CC491E|nr:uncharacterized protein LOC110669905 isoform X2 [Hevea brasiliensis]
MNLSTTSLVKISPFFIRTTYLSPISRRVSGCHPSGVRFPLTITKCSRADVPLASQAAQTSTSSSSSSSSSSSPVIASKIQSLLAVEEDIEKVIYRCRFLAILGVFGSLIGSILCFVKGCTYVVSSFMEYFVNRGKVIILLVEAIGKRVPHRSNLFGLFTLKERPRWLEIKTVNELKTKLGHVIVMLLLIGFFEKSKTAVIHSPMDLLCFSASVLLCSGCLYLLSKLSDSK